MSRRGFIAGVGASLASLGLVQSAGAQTVSPGPTPPIVFENFQLFDGKSNALRGGLRLLVEGNRIKSIAGGDITPPDGARMIDCGGRVIMPGLIDAHWHTIFAALPINALLSADIGYIFLAASAEAERTLMRGFTTIRDLGGPSFPLKQAIDEGAREGSSDFSVGRDDHDDRRPWRHAPPVRSAEESGRPGELPLEQTGGASIADSVDEVRLRVREQLLQGASQIKLVGGGGVASWRTTLDMFTFSEPEFRAGVEAAADRNTYVAVHAYPPAQIQRAIAAGTQCIEHGHLMDEKTAMLMAEKGIWLRTQPFVSEEDTPPMVGQSQINLRQVIAGTNTVYALAKEHKVKTAFGTDLLFSTTITERQGLMLNHLEPLV